MELATLNPTTPSVTPETPKPRPANKGKWGVWKNNKLIFANTDHLTSSDYLHLQLAKDHHSIFILAIIGKIPEVL